MRSADLPFINSAIIGTRRAIRLNVDGSGTWTRWRGKAELDLSQRPTARLALGVDQGRYRLQGQWAPAQFLTGKLQRLTVPLVTIRGDATLKNRLLDGTLTPLRSFKESTITNNADRRKIEWLSYGSWDDQYVKVDGKWFFKRHTIYNENNANRFTAGQSNPLKR